MRTMRHVIHGRSPVLLWQREPVITVTSYVLYVCICTLWFRTLASYKCEHWRLCVDFLYKKIVCQLFGNLITCYISIFCVFFDIFLVVCLRVCFFLPKR